VAVLLPLYHVSCTDNLHNICQVL